MMELKNVKTGPHRNTRNAGASFKLEDYARMEAACKAFGLKSMGSLVRAVMLDWLDEFEKESKEEK